MQAVTMVRVDAICCTTFITTLPPVNRRGILAPPTANFGIPFGARRRLDFLDTRESAA